MLPYVRVGVAVDETNMSALKQQHSSMLAAAQLQQQALSQDMCSTINDLIANSSCRCFPCDAVICPYAQIDVAMDETNTQIITIKSDVEAGRLLLHWGVEGGKDYKGGWRLPDHSCRPDGTQQYKDRALQTPFRCVWVCFGGGGRKTA